MSSRPSTGRDPSESPQRAQRLVLVEFLRTGAGRVDDVPERVALRTLDLPAALQALLVNGEQRRLGLVAQQRIERQERELVVRVIDVAGHHHFLVADEQVIPVPGDQIVVRGAELLAMRRVAGHVHGDAQVRQQMEGAQAGLVSVLPDQFRRPPAPARPLAVDVDQLIVVVDDVIGDAVEGRPQRRLLGVVGHQVVVDRIDEVVADDLVGAGVPFPPPRLVRRVVPFAVLRLLVFSDLDERARRKAGPAGDLLETEDRLHAPPGVVARGGVAGHLEPEALGRHVHRGPEAVVVRRPRLIGREIAGDTQGGIGGEAPSQVPRLDAPHECLRLLRQRRHPIVDARIAFRRLEPRGIAVDRDAGDLIVGQPAEAGEVFVAAVAVAVPDRPASGADPQCGPGVGAEHGHVRDRPARDRPAQCGEPCLVCGSFDAQLAAGQAGEVGGGMEGPLFLWIGRRLLRGTRGHRQRDGGDEDVDEWPAPDPARL